MTDQGTPTPTRLDLPQRAALLRRSYIFRDLDADLLRQLAGLTVERRLAKGTLLFHEGDEGDALFAVVSGIIRISVAGRTGKELTLGLMESGDVFGEIALLDGLPRTATAHAVEDCLLMVIERKMFLTVLERDARLARHIIELLCERMRDNTTRLGEFAFLDLRQRLARKLQALAVAYGKETTGGIEIAFKLSQGELAQMLGVSREAVNKQLKVWADLGLVNVGHGNLVITNQAKLAAIAKAEDD